MKKSPLLAPLISITPLIMAAGILNINHEIIPVNEQDRQMDLTVLRNTIRSELKEGVKFFAVVLNLRSTMYGSVDNLDAVAKVLKEESVGFLIHVDAAFGGFMYPFTNHHSEFNFKNPYIIPITLDAHKMLQAPYGTGIYLARTGYIEEVLTEGASYVKGQDCTLSGSRSGANAISVWMILRAYGSEGGKGFCKVVWERTNHLCEHLDELKVSYFREKFMNIVTIPSKYISEPISRKFHLVPDCHDNPN